MRLRIILVPLLALALVATAFADEGGVEKQDHKVIVTKPAAAADAYATVLGMESGAVVVGEHRALAERKLQALIEELVNSGHLTEAGAKKLREALAGMDGPQAYTTLKAGEEPGKAAMKVIVRDVESDEGHKVITVVPEGEMEVKAHTLTIIRDDEGHVTIDGEGFSEEQLAEIRKQLEEQSKYDLRLFEFHPPLGTGTYDDDYEASARGIHKQVEQQGHCEMQLDEHAEAMDEFHKQLGVLKLEDGQTLSLDELGAGHLQGVLGLLEEGEHAEAFVDAQELQRMLMLELKGLKKLELLAGVEGLEDLKELEELKGLHILGELGELKHLEELELLEELPGLKALELEELYQLHESDVDELLGLKGYEAFIQDWGEDFEADLEAEIEEVLKQVEVLLREFAERHAH